MTRGLPARIVLAGLPTSALFICSSCIYVNVGGEMERYERELELTAPLEPGSSFSADTDDGSITIRGSETSQCRMQAKIVAHARTEERARELAEEIEVSLEPSGSGLKVVTKRPPIIRNAWFAVSIRAEVPTQTNLNLETSDGSVHVANITGSVDAKTSDGSVEAEAVKGDVRLRTSDGDITCTRLEAAALDVQTSDGGVKLTDTTARSCTARTSDGNVTLMNVRADSITARTSDGAIHCRAITAGRVDCHTSDGSIRIEYAGDAPKALNVSATTSNGGITLTTPPGLSAVIDASTDDGSIRSDLPITIQGKFGKSLHGTIGAGEGKVYLRTHDGSITIQ